MNLFALLMGMVLAIASFILFFAVSALGAAHLGDLITAWTGLKDQASHRLVVGDLLYTLVLVGSWVYADRLERSLNPRHRVRWDIHAFVLVAFPFFVFFLAQQLPQSLLLVLLFVILIKSFYDAIKVSEERQEEREKVPMAPVSD